RVLTDVPSRLTCFYCGLKFVVLPDVAEETISPSRVRTMKDFETQITELRKENFNLKLRIYFLEEHMQQKFDGPNEDICRVNIELKVELESLKRELQERERLLVKASKAVESLAQGGDAEVQALKEEMQKKAQQVECLASRMKILEEDLRVAQEETGKALAVTEQERVLRLAAERQLSLRASVPPKEAEVLTSVLWFRCNGRPWLSALRASHAKPSACVFLPSLFCARVGDQKPLLPVVNKLQ
uniref:Centrosomin N-terminal motif 1 domain-containing protein n=1 Tax=Varanus komodoensis TaxID=61221 RepID=A0A8D2LTX9_VARKO